MFSRRRFLPLGALALFALLAACGNEAKKSAEVKSIEDRFPIRIGERVVQLQVAARPAEMEKGLMFVKAMGEEQGMIFVFARPQAMSFWMRHTEIALDIGYIDATGELKEIYPMFPHDEKSVRSIGRLQFALEMNQGWFARNGVKPGARLDLKALAEALRARGLRPDQYGLK